jgi:hypothetical protein
MLGFGQERRNSDVLRRLRPVGVAGACTQVAIAVPGGPVPEQQTQLVRSPDQVLKRHPVHLFRRGRRPLNEPPGEAVAQFVRVFEALDQAVAELLIGRFAVMTRQSFTQFRNNVAQWRDINCMRGTGHVTASWCDGWIMVKTLRVGRCVQPNPEPSNHSGVRFQPNPGQRRQARPYRLNECLARPSRLENVAQGIGIIDPNLILRDTETKVTVQCPAQRDLVCVVVSASDLLVDRVCLHDALAVEVEE